MSQQVVLTRRGSDVFLFNQQLSNVPLLSKLC